LGRFLSQAGNGVVKILNRQALRLGICSQRSPFAPCSLQCFRLPLLLCFSVICVAIVISLLLRMGDSFSRDYADRKNAALNRLQNAGYGLRISGMR